jgi:hypothetical protein
MTVAGFFTEGIEFQLPHPALDDSVLLVTHEAIARAFALLRALPPAGFDLSSAQENAITQQLEWILENRLRKTGEVPGFDERVFRKVRRGAEVTNFDGKHPSKKPDLVFDLARDTPLVLSTLDALFVECKPVDASHPLPRHYGEMGAWRFICGDYSWAMQEGMMLAYVRNGHTLAASLSHAFAAEPLKTMLGNPTPIGPVPGGLVNPMVEELHVTTHRRNFAWPQGRGDAGPIRIYHSWHNCSWQA